ncbi:MAG: hypothetical protein BAA04_03595 [Firmicutes bacterium ZCTH02-B6]|nr:MAG: hypothetical protein BAA04_03595 [Firmicutes bacterium ZCTH02-B6]
MADNVRKTVYVVPHTHWDREWYEPFQVFRARLVRVLDHAIGVLGRDTRFRRFVLDGQAVILEDYLEARPEREPDIRRLVQDGRLRIGPWYVLADEFLVSPEALIRNLSIGRRVAQRFGRPMPVGYTPDPFGHIAQLPLILHGFGLDAAVFQRGVGDEAERLGLEFIWEASDGSSVLAIQLPATYSAVAGLGHATWDYEEGGAYDADLAVRHVRTILFGDVDPPDELPFWLKLPFSRLRGDGLAGRSRSQALLLPNGTDHLYLQEDLPDVIEELARALPQVDWVLGDLEEYLDRVRETAGPLERYRGEFRGSRYHHILSGVLSSRAYLKQANDRAQQLLERYAEPLVALARAAGGYDASALLEQAWKLLIKNHFHDSICGCSVDAVHREMVSRFASVTQIGETEARRALARLVGGTLPGVVPEPAPEATLAVFNPLPYARESVVSYTVYVPEGMGDAVSVLDPSGCPLPVQREVETVFAHGRSDRRVDRVTLMAAVPMPALGVSCLKVAAAADAAVTGQVAAAASEAGAGAQTDFWAVAPDPAGLAASKADVRVDHHALENEYLRFELGPEGPVLIDKATKRRHVLRLRFEDVADAGDSYDFSPLPGDAPIVIDRPAAPARIVRPGPVVGALAAEYRFSVPARLSADRSRREGLVELPVEVVFQLERGARALHVYVSLDNTAEDHRLRLVVSSGVQADYVWAGDSFVWLRRPVRPPKGEGWYQKPQPTAPMRHAVAVSSGEAGFAVMARGLKEYEAIPTASGVDLAVTLLRCVGWLSRDDLLSRPEGAGPSLPVPEAQCLGTHRFELALMPFSGPYWQSPLLRELDAFVTPPMAQAVVLRPAADRGEARAAAGASPAPAAPSDTGGSFLEVSSPLLLSALKPADERDSVIVRIWNPAPEPVEGWIRIGRGRPAVYAVRLDETRLGEERLALDADGRLRVALPPGGVCSYELVDWCL